MIRPKLLVSHFDLCADLGVNLGVDLGVNLGVDLGVNLGVVCQADLNCLLRCIFGSDWWAFLGLSVEGDNQEGELNTAL